MACALHMQEPRWGCRYCGVKILTQGRCHPSDPAAHAVVAPRATGAASLAPKATSRKTALRASPVRLVSYTPSSDFSSSGGLPGSGGVHPRSATLKRRSASSGRAAQIAVPFAYTPN